MIAFDSDGCINCRICEDVCSYRFAGSFKPAVAAIRLERAGKFGRIKAHVCNLCEGLNGGAACVSVCPSAALYLSDIGDNLGEVVKFDPDLCIVCHACVNDCPQDAVSYDQDKDFYNICDLCDGDPECVRWCPENVLWVAGVVQEVAEMAEEEHVQTARRYASLRDMSPEERPDRDTDLRRAELSGADLSGLDLARANLYRANLQDARLRDVNLVKAHLREANLRGADLTGANLSGANLMGANLQAATLTGVVLDNALFHGADLSDATLPDGFKP